MLPRYMTAVVMTAFLTTPLTAQTVFVEQGEDWTRDLRDQFYTEDQGARIMPLAWIRALTQPDGKPFLDGTLTRYGYLPMADRDDPDLPVGFTTNGDGADMAIGMTCAACHTRQIDVGGTAYRIDGGPAIVDFQTFLSDLDQAVLAILQDDTSFDTFAATVLGSKAGDPEKAALKDSVDIWSTRFHTLIERSLPDPAWGPSRLDAVSMIFNRLAGLDLGPEADNYLIPDNIARADAPTRYPFLWNAARQDYTQWPGFAMNGNDLLGLVRNLGEVYGVFGEFHPLDQPGLLFNRDYISVNSANWDGLGELEDWLWDLGAPEWPWDIDRDLAAQGKQVFDRSPDQGGCTNCHGKKTGEFRSIFVSSYATLIVDVGTDTRECQILTRQVKTGVLEGASLKPFAGTLPAEAAATSVLGASVIGAIVQKILQNIDPETRDTVIATLKGEAPPSPEAAAIQMQLEFLRDALPSTTDLQAIKSSCKYEARVLDGIWAAAPYLHNGSVPTLADLLNKPEDRPASFTPGPNYDLDKVGMATEQTAFGHVIETTGCDDLDSGNSRCGHDWGTDLSQDDKQALLEYLKSI